MNPENELLAGPAPAFQNKTIPGTKTDDVYAIEVVTGPQVIDALINDTVFQQSWDALYAACPWATVFQSRPFIAAWYQVYCDQHLPILIKAIENGQLKGLLSVVLLNTNANDLHAGNGRSRITGAGHYDAEYQTWLAAPADADTFIKKALTELRKQFPGHPITFRFLPPGTSLEWLQDDKKLRACSIVQSYDRPLIDFKDPEASKVFQRNHFKNKINRLKRLGELQFELITDVESFKHCLHEIAVLYDFRQSALFNKSPFKDDPVKEDFLLQLFRLQLLHVTVLKAGGKTMAAVAAVTGNDDWMHLAGINCHSPFNARFYSPGFLHFILLAKKLANEGVHYFDLSPGYDAYKDDLANGHDQVQELVISPTRKFQLKRQLKKWVHTRLIAAGIRPMTTELALKKYGYLMRRRTVLSVIKGMVNRLQPKRKKQLYHLQTGLLPSTLKMALHTNNLRDLMQFEYTKTAPVTRWEFLEDAMMRLERGQRCYTRAENGRLLCCAWFSNPDPGSVAANRMETTIELKRLYCHEVAKDRLPAFVQGVIEEVINKEMKNYLLAADALFCRALEAYGFPFMSA
jgi:hypothetical protein